MTQSAGQANRKQNTLPLFNKEQSGWFELSPFTDNRRKLSWKIKTDKTKQIIIFNSAHSHNKEACEERGVISGRPLSHQCIIQQTQVGTTIETLSGTSKPFDVRCKLKPSTERGISPQSTPHWVSLSAIMCRKNIFLMTFAFVLQHTLTVAT